MTLRTSGPPDSESWRRVWDAATFVTAMCARQGKKGLYTRLGELHFRELASGLSNDLRRQGRIRGFILRLLQRGLAMLTRHKFVPQEGESSIAHEDAMGAR